MKKTSTCIKQSLIVLLFLSGCVVHKRESDIPLFLYRELQDSIEAYVGITPPIENSRNYPTFTQVIFDLIDGDTLVIVRPALSSYPMGMDSVVGVSVLHDRACEIIIGRYGSLKVLPEVINEAAVKYPQSSYDYHTCFPDGGIDEECVFREMISIGKMNRVYIMNRPHPLRLITVDGRDVSIH